MAPVLRCISDAHFLVHVKQPHLEHLILIYLLLLVQMDLADVLSHFVVLACVVIEFALEVLDRLVTTMNDELHLLLVRSLFFEKSYQGVQFSLEIQELLLQMLLVSFTVLDLALEIRDEFLLGSQTRNSIGMSWRSDHHFQGSWLVHSRFDWPSAIRQILFPKMPKILIRKLYLLLQRICVNVGFP